MTKKQIAAKLREALALMNDTGKHWIKGEYSEVVEWSDDDEPLEVGYCSLGAIRHVTDTPLWDGSDVSNELAFALADVLPPLENTFANSPEGQAWDKIVTWNDADDREWNQVVEAFEKAVAKLEA